MKAHVCIITITVKPPKGYKLRRKEYRLVTVSGSGKYGEEEKKNFLDCVKRKYEEVNAEIPLKFSVSSVTHKTEFLCVDGALCKKPSRKPDKSKE